MKILIAGYGKVGESLAQQLSAEGYDITLMDSNPQVLEAGMERHDVMVVQGNCAAMDTLRRANVKKADLLIACTGSDELNLLCCMTARGINPGIHTIARLRNPDYTEQAYTMRDTFGLSMTFHPELEAAEEILRLLQFPGFLKRDSFAKGHTEIVELRIDEGHKLCNVTLKNLYGIINCRVLVCAVLRGEKAVTPSGSFILREGDRIFVTASTSDLSTLLKSLGIVTHKVRRVILAGGGAISYYLAERLQKSRAKMDVRIIEPNAERCRTLAEMLPAAHIVHGDAGDHLLMESEGIATCDALVSMTGLDEMNMILAMYGNRYNVPQVITKLGRAENSKISAGLPIGSVVCPSQLCCNTVVRYVRAMGHKNGAAVTIHSIADGSAEAMEFSIDENALHRGTPLKKLKLKKNILLVSISKGEATEIPNADSTYDIGNSVVIVVSGADRILEFNDIFAPW